MDVVAQQHNVANKQANAHRTMHDDVLNRNTDRDDPILVDIINEVLGGKEEPTTRLPSKILLRRCPEVSK